MWLRLCVDTSDGADTLGTSLEVHDDDGKTLSVVVLDQSEDRTVHDAIDALLAYAERVYGWSDTLPF